MEEKQKLSDITAGLTKFLKTKMYKEACIKKFIYSWEYLEKFMIKSGITFYCRDVGEAFLKDRFGDIPYCDLKKSKKEKVRHIQVLSDYQEKGIPFRKRHIVPEITFTGKLGTPFNEFIEYSKAIKRSESTIQRYKERINTLYLDLHQSDLDISGINTEYLVKYLSHLDETHREVSRNNTIMTIRVFLRYLCTEKLLQNNREEYWMSILKPRSVRQPKIPSVYSREEVERLIDAIDRGNPQGKRDYAMILLAARYGLRASDIIGLRYCNLDWTNNRIVLLQQKTSKKVELPLSEEVGKAIIEYLKFGRPNINEPMPVISEILGHSTSESTMCYLRVDFHQLKQCALEVSCVPSSFYENLYV